MTPHWVETRGTVWSDPQTVPLVSILHNSILRPYFVLNWSKNKRGPEASLSMIIIIGALAASPRGKPTSKRFSRPAWFSVSSVAV
jgi:hypothetical protein